MRAYTLKSVKVHDSGLRPWIRGAEAPILLAHAEDALVVRYRGTQNDAISMARPVTSSKPRGAVRCACGRAGARAGSEGSELGA